MHRLFVTVTALTAALVLAGGAAAWSWPADGALLRPFALGSDAYAAGQHRGIDVGGTDGSPVRAPVSGTISFAGSVPSSGRGVTIATADGYSVTLFHLGSLAVAKGETVAEGVTVGLMGMSGDAEQASPSVHLGVRRTAEAEGYVDPLGLLPARTAQPAPSPPSAAVPAAAPAPAPATQTAASPPSPPPAVPPVPAPSPAPPATATAAAPEPPVVVGTVSSESSAAEMRVTPSERGLAVSSPSLVIRSGSSARPVVVEDRTPIERPAARLERPATVARSEIRTAVPSAAGAESRAAAPTASSGAGRVVPEPRPARGADDGQEAVRPAPTRATLSARIDRRVSGPETQSPMVPALGSPPRGEPAIALRPAERADMAAPDPRRATTADVAGDPIGGPSPTLLAGLVLVAAVAVAGTLARRIGGRGALLPDDADLLRERDPAHRARVHDRGRGHLRAAPAAARP